MCSANDAATARLLHAAAHDLRGPAGRLRLLCQLLARGPSLDADARTLIAHIETSAEEVRVASEALARYAEVRGRELRHERTDLNLIVAGATARFGAPGRIKASPLPVVEGDPQLLSKLIDELLSNAARFAGDAEVRISAARAPDGGWHVSVADDGPGFECGLEERAFLPFKKLGTTSGAGIGLTLAREVAERHGGRLWVEPSGRGADVRFYVSGPVEWADE